MKRWLLFFLVIGVGIAAGLLYGWVVSPVKYVDTSPETLRQDYKTDYVLMVAEAFQTERDTSLALQRLALIRSNPQQDVVQQAIAPLPQETPTR
jgi:hypothetical protein